MVDILMDSFMDTIRVVPVIFILFILTDLIMAKVNQKNQMVDSLAKYDVIGGGLLGLIPQCGIPVGFTRLYGNGYITLGMLFAIFLSSSDEALIIIAAHPEQIGFVLKLVVIKILIGIGVGYLINVLIREKRNRIKGCGPSCDCPKCGKHRNIIVHNLVHTLKIAIFLFITIFILGFGIESIGEEGFHAILGKNTFMQPIYAVLIGAIPSCMSSVVLAEGYIQGVIGLGALIGGLCANTGYGILVLFKELPMQKALKISGLLLLISMVVGQIIFAFGG